MSMEGFKTTTGEGLFIWQVECSGENRVDIRLHKGTSFKSIGEFSFRVTKEKKIDPVRYGLHKRDEPSSYSPEFIEGLRNSESEELQNALKAIETKPSVIARVEMWQINDEARGNLSTVRQLLRLVLQECKKFNVEYIVGSYAPQSHEGLSAAPYVGEMYKRIAIMTGGEVYQHGEVWISVAGLEKWLREDLQQ